MKHFVKKSLWMAVSENMGKIAGAKTESKFFFQNF
jgi:hypothetical protein